MDAALPAPLRDALEALVEGRSGRDLAARAQAISALYRSGAASSQAIRGEDDALAYALTRMPATYAAVRAALEALSDRAPGFAPRTVADIGCGPGTASWAAMEAFASVEGFGLFDNNGPLMRLAETLMQSASVPISVRFGDLARPSGLLSNPTIPDDIPPSADLVIAAYSLVELPEARLGAVVEALWSLTEGALVIVEPGTPAGWARLMAIRSMLINIGATVAAPCPHHAPCPLTSPDWCHFSQRLPRSRAHRLAKGADAPFEDEKYAYLAVVRPAVRLVIPASRVLAPPVEDKAALSLKLCEPSGALEIRRIARRHKAAYRAVRRAGWGDALPE